MKIRNGFVSNSSSSSFIVALPNVKKLTKEQILENIKQDVCYFDEDDYYEKDHFKEEINKIETAINDDFNVIYLNVEYGAENEEMLNQIINAVDGKILIEGE